MSVSMHTPKTVGSQETWLAGIVEPPRTLDLSSDDLCVRLHRFALTPERLEIRVEAQAVSGTFPLHRREPVPGEHDSDAPLAMWCNRSDRTNFVVAQSSGTDRRTFNLSVPLVFNRIGEPGPIEDNAEITVFVRWRTGSSPNAPSETHRIHLDDQTVRRTLRAAMVVSAA